MKRVVVAIDSYKGCMTSAEAGKAAAGGVERFAPGWTASCVTVSDGGEGMADAFADACGGIYVEACVHDALMRKVKARYVLSADRRTAFIEMASAAGLALVEPEKRNPMLTTTYGVGELILDALDKGCRKVVLGLGGSATNDGGTGMLQALGFRFMRGGREIAVCNGAALKDIDDVDMSGADRRLAETEFLAACDVKNVLAGPDGAAYVFAPQKGADSSMVESLDAGLRNFSEVTKRVTGMDVSMAAGAGAAGGMGAGCMAYLAGVMRPGAEVLFDIVGLRNIIKGADLVITGEGKSDRQTLMGKLPAAVLAVAGAEGVPVVVLSGAVDDVENLLDAGFAAAMSILDGPAELEEAMNPERAKKNLAVCAGQICRIMGLGKPV